MPRLDQTFLIRNDPAELVPLAEQVTALLEGQDTPPQTVYAVNLAIEEMASNIIKYGYDDRVPHQIAVRVRCEPGAVTVVLDDDGHPFDPLSREAPDVSQPVEERPIGGLGIFLVRKLCADMQYRRAGGRNILTLLFRGGADASSVGKGNEGS